MLSYYLDILIWLIAIMVLVGLVMGIYSTIKHFKIKERKIKLEEERVKLEKRKLELKE